MNIDDIIENAQLKGRIIALEAEVSSLNAAIRSHERVDCLMVANLKAEVAALVDNQTPLAAEVVRLEFIHQMDTLAVQNLKAEVERLKEGKQS